MNAILNFFLHHYLQEKHEKIESDKAKIFVMLVLIGISLTVILVIQNIIIGNRFLEVISIFPPLALLVISLIVIYRGNVKSAGGIITLGLGIVLSAKGIFVVDPKYSFNFIIDEYYIFLFLIMLTAMFASRRILIINFIVILVSSSVMLFMNYKDFPEIIRFKPDFRFPLYVVILIVTFLVSYFFTKYVDVINEKIKEVDAKNQQMKTITKQVKISSTEIYRASKQLDSIAGKVSEQAGTQASTTENISAAVENLLTMIKTNTSHAINAGESSKKATQAVRDSNAIVSETVKSAEEVSQKSMIINEIADQIDLLSINAAIESARAGNAGKGFSVIAQEIRKLADLTSNAVSSIGEISNKNVTISENTSSQLNKIIPEALKNLEYINQIAEASKEQQNNAESINSSVVQLSDITNKNAAFAEEMSSSSEELSEQAEKLDKLIDMLEIKNLSDM